jgi:hypothetical protein
MGDKSESGAESILRGNAADCDVQRMIGEENLRAVKDGFRTRATTREALAFLAEIGPQLGFILGPKGRCQRQ